MTASSTDDENRAYVNWSLNIRYLIGKKARHCKKDQANPSQNVGT